MPSARITRILKKWSSESEKLASSAVFARRFLLAIAYGFVPHHVSAANCTAIVFPIVSVHSRHVSRRELNYFKNNETGGVLSDKAVFRCYAKKSRAVV